MYDVSARLSIITNCSIYSFIYIIILFTLIILKRT